MANKTPTHQVIHDSLNFMRNTKNGKLEVVEKGTQLVLNSKQAALMEARGFVSNIKDVKKIDASNINDKQPPVAETKHTK